MMKIEILPATEKHIDEIARAVRPEDVEELWAATMQTPKQAMLLGLQHSDQAMVGLIDDRAVCVWGVVNESLIGPCGAPWMVGTVLLDHHAKTFLRRCRKVVASMFDGYEHLENYVDARNTRAIQWLKWLGFNVEEKTEEHGALKLPFHKFTMRSHAYV